MPPSTSSPFAENTSARPKSSPSEVQPEPVEALLEHVHHGAVPAGRGVQAAHVRRDADAELLRAPRALVAGLRLRVRDVHHAGAG